MSATLARLRSKLLATGSTQIEIADATGVSQTTVSRVLNGQGRQRIDTIEALEAYADAVARAKGKRDKRIAAAHQPSTA